MACHPRGDPAGAARYRPEITTADRFPTPPLDTDPAGRERLRAAATAGHTGDAAAARLLLGDDDARVRAAAVGALGRLQALTPAELATALADRDPGVRRRALEVAAATATTPPPAWSLLPLLADPDPTVAETAAWACGECQPAPAGTVTRVAALATGHDDALVREAAVAALGALGDPAGLDAILAGCSDKPAVRRRAVLALAPFEGDAVDAALAAAREDRDWQVRQAAEDLS